MKDIKLTIEDIKKIFECFEVEGFEYNKGWISQGRFKFSINNLPNLNIDLRFQETVYPLFLQRVRQAISKSYWNDINNYIIEISDCDIYVYHSDDRDNHLTRSCENDPMLEQAIKYILDKL